MDIYVYICIYIVNFFTRGRIDQEYHVVGLHRESDWSRGRQGIRDRGGRISCCYPLQKQINK